LCLTKILVIPPFLPPLARRDVGGSN